MLNSSGRGDDGEPQPAFSPCISRPPSSVEINAAYTDDRLHDVWVFSESANVHRNVSMRNK